MLRRMAAVFEPPSQRAAGFERATVTVPTVQLPRADDSAVGSSDASSCPSEPENITKVLFQALETAL